MRAENKIMLANHGTMGAIVILIVAVASFCFSVVFDNYVDNMGAIMAGVFAGSTLRLITTNFGKYVLTSPVSRRSILRSLFSMVVVMVLLCMVVSFVFSTLGALAGGKSVVLDWEIVYSRMLLAVWLLPALGMMIYAFIKYSKIDAIMVTLFAAVLILGVILFVVLVAGTLTGGDGSPGYIIMIPVSAVMTLWAYGLSQRTYRKKDF